MIKTKIDLDKLSKIADITEPARNKSSWKRDFFSYRYEKYLKQAFKSYADFWLEVIKRAFPTFDENAQGIYIPAIKVSKTADEIIQKILPSVRYLMYSPSIDESLKGDECLIDEKRVLVKKGVNDDDRSDRDSGNSLQNGDFKESAGS
ncbi:MAG: hypothetical protein QXQ53_08795 [Candidatus Methanosuratincola sp.]